MKNKIITIIGGTGFLGRHVVELLAGQGYQIRVVARDIDSAAHLKTSGDVGQIALVSGDITVPSSLYGKLANSFAVVNLAGILYESGKQKFDSVHAKGAEKLAELAKSAGVKRLIQVSAIGADNASRSEYARSKAAGEQAVKVVFPGATILRPSIIFGSEDKFFNKFAGLAAVSPFLPLIGGGKTKFQPVYVADVAHAIMAAIEKDEAVGQTFEIGGPDIYSFREILEFICKVINRRPLLLNIPFPVASVIGAVAKFLPCPPLTADQVTLLKNDNIVGTNVKTLSNLGISAGSVPAIVPLYLARLAGGGRV